MERLYNFKLGTFHSHSKEVVLTTWIVELIQASRFNHQSNWKVKSRAQATGENLFLIRKIYQLTFHLTECSVQHVGLVYCKNHSKLLENVNPDLNHEPVSLSSWDLEKIDPAGEVHEQACDDGWEYVEEDKKEQVEDCPHLAASYE